MKKISEYGLGLLCWLNALVCCASEKFEILPDLPDPLAAYAQSAEASTVSGNGNLSSIVGGGSVGHELDLVQVLFALLFTILLIYASLIIIAKIKKSGFDTLRKVGGNISKSQASVISTTALGNNKTLHVIELDGKRMLIGASSGAIQLIKDLGSVPTEGGVEEEFSSIEIPTIKIPKIEIPKIEIPTIGFSKLATKIHKDFLKNEESVVEDSNVATETDVHQEETAEGIIDSLFTKPEAEENAEEHEESATLSEHTVDPDEYALYKKYLG